MTSTASSSPCARPAPPTSTWRPTAGSATAGSPKDRLSLCKAYIAKAVWDFPTTRDLIDAAYDAKEIRPMSERLGHVAIIDHNPRRGEKKEFSPAQAIRYRQRSSAERVHSHRHDNHGGRHVRVRGAVKVAAHLSFGLLVIAAEQLLTMLC